MDGTNDGGNKQAAYFGIPIDCDFSPVVFEECMNEYFKSLRKKSAMDMKPGSLEHGEAKTFGDNGVKVAKEKADTSERDDEFGGEDVWSNVDLGTITDVASLPLDIESDGSLAIDGFYEQGATDQPVSHENEVMTPSLLTFAGQLPASFLHRKTSSKTRSELDAPSMPKRK